MKIGTQPPPKPPWPHNHQPWAGNGEQTVVVDIKTSTFAFSFSFSSSKVQKKSPSILDGLRHRKWVVPRSKIVPIVALKNSCIQHNVVGEKIEKFASVRTRSRNNHVLLLWHHHVELCRQSLSMGQHQPPMDGSTINNTASKFPYLR